MAYYIGIDGGGTSTVGCIGTATSIIKTITKGSSNYKGSGREAAERNITSLILELTQDINPHDVQAICFGGAGVDSPADVLVFKEIIEALRITDKILIVNDAKSGLVGAVNDYAGAVVISGTGSILYGIDENGKDYRVGGWGHIIGDEGSGYALGRETLTLLSKDFDGMLKESSFVKAIKEHYEIHSKESLINFVYNENTGKATIASLAKIAVSYYEKDNYAKEIIDKEIDLLVEQVTQLYKNMGEEPMKLATIGSLLTKSEIYRKQFIESLGRKVPSIDVICAINSPEVGAYKLALHTER